MTAPELHSLVKPIKRRLTPAAWMTLLIVAAHPQGLTFLQLRKERWCGTDSTLRKNLAGFKSINFITRTLVKRTKPGRPILKYHPTEKAYKLLGVETGTPDRLTAIQSEHVL